MALSSDWAELWPLADQLEELCLAAGIAYPTYHRVTKNAFIAEFRALDSGAIPERLAANYRRLAALDPADFDRVYHELYNPWRISERKVH